MQSWRSRKTPKEELLPEIANFSTLGGKRTREDPSPNRSVWQSKKAVSRAGEESDAFLAYSTNVNGTQRFLECQIVGTYKLLL